MSLVQKCDICGKNEGRDVKFGDRPLSVRLNNHRGQKYNVYAMVWVECDADTQLARKFLENDGEVTEKVFRKAVKAGIIGPAASGAAIKVDQQGNVTLASNKQVSTQDVIYPSLKNPAPAVCDRCKRIMMKYVQAYGNEETVEF